MGGQDFQKNNDNLSMASNWGKLNILWKLVTYQLNEIRYFVVLLSFGVV